jgi:protein-S-isoprenylcysteine O-methyltransferase Ste14
MTLRFHPTSRLVGRALGDALLLVLLGGFAYANFQAWRHSGRPIGLGSTAFELLTVTVFVYRRRPHSVTADWRAWPIATLATFLMLLGRPSHGHPSPACELIQLAGLALAAASLAVLARSFGIVAANRGIKTGGPYQLVRHPAYLGYLLTWSAYAAENPSIRNITLLAAAAAGQLARIHQEEHLLARDPAYQTYRSNVKYRLIPHLY